MFLELLTSVLAGFLIGIITGLTPGLHINLASVMIVSIASKTNTIKPEYAAVAILSMAITHTFLDTIPSVFLGVPDPEKVAVMLPTHRMVSEGKGYEAATLTIFGSFASLIVCMAAMPAFIALFRIIQDLVKNYIGLILIALTAVLIIYEKKKINAIAIFLLSGALGYIVLNTSLLNEPLLPMLSGLFGISGLIVGVMTDSKITKQKITESCASWTIKIKATICAVIVGAAGSFLPGIGPSQIAILGSRAFRNLGDKGYIILVGGLNTVNMALSIAMLYAADKARNGAIVAISQIINGIDMQFLLILCATCLIAAGLSTVLTMIFAKKLSGAISKLNYKTISIGIMIFIIFLVALLSGWFGMIVLFTATALGLACNELDTAKNHMMGCLLIPVIIFFLK